MFNRYFNKPYKIIFGDDTHKIVFAKNTAEALGLAEKDKEFIKSIKELHEKHKDTRVGLIIELDRSPNAIDADDIDLTNFIVTKYSKGMFNPHSSDNKRGNEYTKIQGRKPNADNSN